MRCIKSNIIKAIVCFAIFLRVCFTPLVVHDLPSTARQSNATKPLKIKLQNLPLRHLPLHVLHINVVFSLIRIPQEYTRT